MAGKIFECPHCEKVFDYRDSLDKHLDLKHSLEKELEYLDSNRFKEGFRKFKEIVNTSFQTGFVLGVLITSLVFSGFIYTDYFDQDTEVPVKVVTCEDCDYSAFEEATERMFRTSYTEVDYQSEEGQELIEQYEISYIPGFIYGEEIEQAENFTAVHPNLVEYDEGYRLSQRDQQPAQRLSNGFELEQ